MGSVPGPWETLLLIAAVYRLWRLLAFDEILDSARWVIMRGGERFERAERFLQCPWCFGFWLALAAWLAWLAWPHAVIVACVPFALSTGVGLIPRNLDK